MFSFLVEKEVEKKRLKECAGCQAYFPITNQCLDCGCIVLLKAKLVDARCPRDKWEKKKKEMR